MAFEKVTRQRAKLRMALTGVSGAGKTLGALYIAYGITGDWSRIALIDTEHERARFYASRSDLDTGEFLGVGCRRRRGCRFRWRSDCRFFFPRMEQ